MHEVTPTLARICIYPFKSLDGMVVDHASLVKKGSLQNDRRFALINDAGNIINANRSDGIYRLHAQYSSDLQTITLGDRTEVPRRTFHIAEERAELEAWLSEFLRLSIRLMENKTGGFPDDPDAHGPTIISTATLNRIREWFPELTLDEVRKRFRANLEIDGVPPFWEDCLFGIRSQPVPFQLGKVRMQGVNPCARCVVPSRSPFDGERTSNFQKRFAELRRAQLPDWSEKSQFDHYYRLAVNTSLPADNSAFELQQGDLLTIG